VILSTRPEWKYRPMVALSERARDEIASTLPYGEESLVPLAWHSDPIGDGGLQWVRAGDGDYLARTREVNGGRWQLHVLDDARPARVQAWLVGLTAALACAMFVLLALAWWQRRRAMRQKLANQTALQAAHDSLESKVAERTEELRRTQNELVHAGKMAALGQMSAGMVHELSQPLGAMRTLSDNACVLLDHQRHGEVRGNLVRIARLVDRLGTLTHQLKAFAYKTQQAPTPVALRHAIANAQFLVAERLRNLKVALEIDVQPPELAAVAEDARLEQVLCNLFGNALDAMAQSPVRRLRVQARAEGPRCLVTVQDSGPGIPDDILARLFEPFTTTKPAGAGLGLGLMISAHIVRDFGGSLAARNLPGGGACFSIELPLPSNPVENSP